MWLVIVSVVFVLLVLLVCYNYEDNPLDILPTPPSLPFLGNAILIFKIEPNSLFSSVLQFTERYGDRYLFKVFNRRVLNLSRPDDIEVVLSHSRNITKSLPYEFIRSWLGTGLLLNSGASWHKRRKVLTPTFHFNILKNFGPVMEEKSRDFVQRLKNTAGAEVDVQPMISDLTLYTICETAMGTPLDSDKSSTAMEYKNAIHNIGFSLLNRLTKFWLHSDFIFKLFGGQQFEKYLRTVISFADKVILEKKKKRTEKFKNEVSTVLNGEHVGIKKRLAMLDLLLEAESIGEIDLTGIRDEVNTFMFAGHDTTAMALSFCFMLLASHDDVQDKIYEESTQILGISAHPTISDLVEMKYLEAVIKETLRLYPSVPFIGRDTTEEFMLGDLRVKKGTEISVHIYELHHRADIYPEPESFRPERFLGGEKRHPYAYIPFSAGPRNCIGQRFAMQEIKFVITEVCRSFKLVPRVKRERPRLKSDMMLRPVEPIYIKFIPRQ